MNFLFSLLIFLSFNFKNNQEFYNYISDFYINRNYIENADEFITFLENNNSNDLLIDEYSFLILFNYYKEKGLTEKYNKLKKSYNFIDDYNIFGPFDIPEGQFFDFSPSFLKQKYNNLLFNNTNFKTTEYYIDIPVEYSKEGFYLIETYCKIPVNKTNLIKMNLPKSFKMMIDNKIYLSKSPLNTENNYNIANLKINGTQQKDEIIKLEIKTFIDYSKKSFVSIENAVCSSEFKNDYNKNNNLNIEISNTAFENYSKTQVIKNSHKLYDLYEFNLNKGFLTESLKYLKEFHNSVKNYFSFKQLILFYYDNKLFDEFNQTFAEFLKSYSINDDFDLLKVLKKYDYDLYVKNIELLKDKNELMFKKYYLEILLNTNIDLFNKYLREVKEKFVDFNYFDEKKDNKIEFSLFKPLEKMIDENIIINKEIILTQEKNNLVVYRHYLFNIVDTTDFFNHYKLPQNAEVIEFKTIKDNKILEIPFDYIDNDILFKQVKNNTFFEIKYKISYTNLQTPVYLQEKFFKIKNFVLKCNKDINLLKINHLFKQRKEESQNNLYVFSTDNLEPYIEEPFSPEVFNFLPYFIINTENLNYLSEKKYNIKYNNFEIDESLNNIKDIKEAYHYVLKNSENKTFDFYNWLKINNYKPKILDFCLFKNNINLCNFNYPIIENDNEYFDFNIPFNNYNSMPFYLNNKNYLEFDDFGNSLYKKFNKNIELKYNNVIIDLKIAPNLDEIEGELKIYLLDIFKYNFENLIKKYSEDDIEYYLKLYLTQKINNASLLDYDIQNTGNVGQPLMIYLKFSINNPFILKQTNHKEELLLKNIFNNSWIDVLTDYPSFEKYAMLSKRNYPLFVYYFLEETTINIKLDDENYKFKKYEKNINSQTFDNFINDFSINGDEKKLYINSKIFLNNSFVYPENYKNFYNFIQNSITFKNSVLNNIYVIPIGN